MLKSFPPITTKPKERNSYKDSKKLHTQFWDCVWRTVNLAWLIRSNINFYLIVLSMWNKNSIGLIREVRTLVQMMKHQHHRRLLNAKRILTLGIKVDKLNQSKNYKRLKCVHEMQCFLQSKRITIIGLARLPQFIKYGIRHHMEKFLKHLKITLKHFKNSSKYLSQHQMKSI